MYKIARKRAGLTVEEAAFRLHVAPRTLAKYESGENTPPPEVVLGMARAYHQSLPVQHYCRKCCAIGAACRYEVLDRVNLDPASVILKLGSEMREAASAFDRMAELAVNKRRREDFTDAEWSEFMRCFGEFMDVEHNVEALRLSLAEWADIAEPVGQHNRKCRDRGYATTPEPMEAKSA